MAWRISDGTGNTAHAKTHLAAGGAIGVQHRPPSNFGNIVVIGNIGAFASRRCDQRSGHGVG